MALEIERKFLVLDDSYKREAFSSSHIRQGYICSERGRTVRIRMKETEQADGETSAHAYLTIKGPSQDGGMSRYEFEQEIPVNDAEQMLSFCQSVIIDKRRWLVKSGRHTFEIDEFFGDNEGLVMAEVELSDTKESPEIPHFIGKEVTGDHRYYNGYLSRHPFRFWQAEGV